MNLSVQERSNYFRGMLVLMRMDRKIEEGERKILEYIGKLLGFEKSFLHNAIEESIENEFLLEDIPTFSHKEFAKSFILDGLKLAVSDNELNPDELSYLKSTIEKNNLDEQWFSEQLENLIIDIDENYYDSTLHVEKYL